MADDGTGKEDGYKDLHERWVRGLPLAELDTQVGSCKRGRWSPDELALLRSNVDHFIQENDVRDLDEFIFSRKRGERSDFYRDIAKGIQRPIFTIYTKVIHLFNVRNYVGRWSSSQEKELMRLQGLHGNRWSIIGRELGVSGRAAQDKYRNLKHRERVGKWSVCEEERLSGAVRSLGTESWQNIAECVRTRNGFQCRQKWVHLQAWRESGGEKTWSECDDVQLLHSLAGACVETEDAVKWACLCEGWEAARSASYLRTKWTALRRGVPRYQHNTFSDNLEYLLEHRLPALERLVHQNFSHSVN
ncbi:cyclin-D-binding Myb-like transcription factor 1 [Halichondria panicea]|uniref:cyclin-D-binding Myb-like transcription factor 1 n=1 Tax=Halichondria panicea TaxID=6063 RepID=UPI00312B56F9